MPLGWTTAYAPDNTGTCKNHGGLAYPCRSLKDTHSGLCLTAGYFGQAALSMQVCDPASEVHIFFAKTKSGCNFSLGSKADVFFRRDSLGSEADVFFRWDQKYIFLHQDH